MKNRDMNMRSAKIDDEYMLEVSELIQQIVKQALNDDENILQESVAGLAGAVGRIDLRKVDLSHVHYPHFLKDGAFFPSQWVGVSKIIFDPNLPTIVARGDGVAHVVEILQGVFNAAHAYRVLQLPDWVKIVRIRKQESAHFRPFRVNREYLQAICLSEAFSTERNFRGTLLWLYFGKASLMAAGRIQFWAGENR